MSALTNVAPVVLEPAAQKFAEATASPPYLFDLGPVEGRKTVDQVQSGQIAKPEVDVQDTTIPGGPSGAVSIRIMRPKGSSGQLPVILYTHGAGWVFGNAHTHDRLIRELTTGTGAAVVFTNYSLSPEARYPTAIEEIYAALTWVAEHGSEQDLDGSRIVVAGDSVGGNMTAAITLMAKQRSGPKLARAGAVLSRHRRELRHRLVPPVRRGLLPTPRRDGVVLGPVHHRREPAQRDHRLAAARNERRSRRTPQGARDHR